MASFLLKRPSVYGTEDKVVLDLGTAYVKVGFSGESSPRCILYNEGIHAMLAIRREVDQDKRKALLSHLQSCLHRLLHAVFFNHLLIDSKQRKIILCENVLLPFEVKQLVVDILFSQLQVASITFFPSSLLALMTTGKSHGLVIDCGYYETQLVALYDDRPMFSTLKTLPHGGLALSSSLLQSTNLDSILKSCHPEMMEDIKIQACYCSLEDTPAEHAVDFNHTIQTLENIPETIHIPANTRTQSTQTLLQEDEDGNSICNTLINMLEKLPVDTRISIASNIVLVGGCAMIPGFKRKLELQVNEALKNRPTSLVQISEEKIQFSTSCFAGNITSWMGGSLFGSLKAASAHELLQADYEKEAILPDWILR